MKRPLARLVLPLVVLAAAVVAAPWERAGGKPMHIVVTFTECRKTTMCIGLPACALADGAATTAAASTTRGRTRRASGRFIAAFQGGEDRLFDRNRSAERRVFP